MNALYDGVVDPNLSARNVRCGRSFPWAFLGHWRSRTKGGVAGGPNHLKPRMKVMRGEARMSAALPRSSSSSAAIAAPDINNGFGLLQPADVRAWFAKARGGPQADISSILT